MRPLLFLLLVPLPVLAGTVRIPEVRIPEEESSWGDSQVRLPLRCDASLSGEVLLSTSTASGGSCPQTWSEQTVEVRGPEEQVWLAFERQTLSSEPPLPALELECRGRQLRVRCGRAPAADLKLWPDGHVSVEPGLEQELKRRLSAPARGRVKEARCIEYVVGLLPEGEATSRLWSLALTHRIFEQRAAGETWWAWELPSPEVLKALPKVASQVRKLKQQEEQTQEALRRKREEALHRNPPWRAQALRRLGPLPKLPTLAPELDAELFWRGSEVCVSQQDDSGMMRCFDTFKDLWGPSEPLRSAAPERSLVRVTGGCGGLCVAEGACVAGEVSGTPVGATLDGEHILMLHGGRWTTEEEEGPTLSPATVSAAMAVGPGGRVLGESRYLIVREDQYRGVAGGKAGEWALFPAPPQEPEGGRWLHVVVSPDQHHVAAISGAVGERAPFILWVADIVPGRLP